MYKVKYDLYREPTDLKQISKWPLGFGLILLTLTLFILYLGDLLPLELYLFYLIEVVGDINLHLLALSTIFITMGIILERLSWRSGELLILEDRILINGKKEFYLKYDGITRVKYLKSNILQVRTRYFPVRIKFKKLEHIEKIVSLLEKKNKGVTQKSPR